MSDAPNVHSFMADGRKVALTQGTDGLWTVDVDGEAIAVEVPRHTSAVTIAMRWVHDHPKSKTTTPEPADDSEAETTEEENI